VRKVEPYALVLYQNGLYVVGRDVQKDLPRTFAVERMKRVKALANAPFKRDPAFDVSKLFEGAFGLIAGTGAPQHVVVDFAPKAVALYMEPREWHHSQRSTRLDDGGLRVEFRRVEPCTEVVSWVLRWGPDAVVREPPELVTRVREALQRTASRYESVEAALPQPVGETLVLAEQIARDEAAERDDELDEDDLSES
jgi:predicted DNA-binding transcriptional regulator YafY